MDDGEAPVAAQISQADIIECQAETIASLKRQVHKSSEYKQLTKSKLKEAAARLKEYRLRVETLLQTEQTLKQQLVQSEHAACGQTKPQERAVPQLNLVRTTATQTDAYRSVTRASQTHESGPVAQATNSKLVDPSVDVAVDTGTGRELRLQEVDHVVPALVKPCNVPLEDPLASIMTEPLQAVAGSFAPHVHHTSAALDAELALSDVEDAGDNSMASVIQEPSLRECVVSCTISKETVPNTSEKGLRRDTEQAVGTGGTALLPQGIVVSGKGTQECNRGRADKRGTKMASDPCVESATQRLRDTETSALNPSWPFEAMADAIDKELALSSDDEDAVRDARTRGPEGGPTGGQATGGQATGNGTPMPVLSVDEEVDEEFAALEFDDEETPAARHDADRRARISSTSDSSTSNDSDSDDEDTRGGTDARRNQGACEQAKALVGLNAVKARGTPRGHDSPVRAATLSSLPSRIGATLRDDERTPARSEPRHVQPRHVVALSPPLDKQLCVGSTASHATRATESSDETRNVARPHEVIRSPRMEQSPLSRQSRNDGGRTRSRTARDAQDATIPFDSASKHTRTPLALGATPTNPLAPATNGPTRLQQSRAVLHRVLQLGDHGVADSSYVRRTLTELAKQSAKFIHGPREPLVTLCECLADALQQVPVAPLAIVRGVLAIFRTPRSRRVVPQGSTQGLCWVYTHVLLRLLGHPTRLDLATLDTCLRYLQAFLFDDRGLDGTTAHGSKDTVFVAHVCTLWTQLCRSTTQVTRARVVLFDLVREHPNVRGVYYAAAMVDVDPAILAPEYDPHGVVEPGMIKETLLYALVAIARVEATRETLLLHQSSLAMIHRIATAIQRPDLATLDATSPLEWIRQLLQRVHTPPVAYFELAKCLELCVAVFGSDLVTHTFPLDACTHLFEAGDRDDKRGVVALVCHMAARVACPTRDWYTSSTGHEEYVAKVLAWLDQVVSTETNDTSHAAANRLEQLAAYSSGALAVLRASSVPAPQRVLKTIVQWVHATPSDQLMDLPASFLRRLRCAVVAACPPVDGTEPRR